MLSMMEQERLNGLAWILVYHDITIDVNVINMFACKSPSSQNKVGNILDSEVKISDNYLNEKDLI